ncbi:MAG: acyl-CoA dehydrogenase family protein [Streptosporangiaceae bacterium]
MQRDVFTADHEAFRLVVREFVEREVVPLYAEWERAGELPRKFFRQLGALGVMGMAVPEEYGGAGDSDYRYNVVLQEEAARAQVTLGTLRTQLEVILPYFLGYSSEEQRRRWLPGLAAGKLLTAIAMTEPDTGSDLAGMRTTAVRDGGDYVLNGAKTFITGGLLADLVIVVARTSTEESDRRAGLTLLVVEDGMPGFVKGRKLDKLGCKVQDTAELSFADVRVPAGNRLGEEGEAFRYLRHNLVQERMTIAVGSVTQARAALDATVAYVSARKVFGTTVGSFQNTKFELAAVAAEIEAAQALLDAAIRAHAGGRLDGVDAAKTKLFCTEMQGRVVDRCLQLFGGYGYITEFPIARLYADARVTRIYGGTSEVMKLIISKSLGL